MPFHLACGEGAPFSDGRFYALATRLLEGLGVQDVGVVATTPKVPDSPEDLEVRPSELGMVFRAEANHTACSTIIRQLVGDPIFSTPSLSVGMAVRRHGEIMLIHGYSE